MVQAIIGLGSNLGDRQKNIQIAWQKLGEIESVTLGSLSNPYLTEPVAMKTASWFTNAVGCIETSLSPLELLKNLLQIESELGRKRTESLDRPVDMDILYYNDMILSRPELTLPHPEIQKRLFVLAPLEELAPDYQHPVLLKSTTEMLQSLASEKVVKKTSWQENGETE